MGAVTSSIVDSSGRPLLSAAAYRSVHGGADLGDPDLLSWNPSLQSPDVEVLPEWGTMVARTRDIVRNHGIASGAVQTHLDNVIGPGLRLNAKPDWRALGLPAEWAEEWSRNVEARWRQFADDIDFGCDFARRQNFAGLLAQGYRSYLVSSEQLATIEWKPRPGVRYATCVQMVQPDRLSNPQGRVDSDTLRGGVQTDPETGEPLGYHIRNGHPNDVAMSSLRAAQWTYVPTFTPWGRRRVIHVYDAESPGQSRGKTGFASVLAKMRVMDRFEKATLQAAIINAMYAAVIESDLGHADVAAALGGGGNPIDAYMKAKSAFAKEVGPVHFDGARVTHLLPGEKFNLLSAEHPSAAFSEFESATLRHIAAGLNLSYEQLSRDYSKTNYSSARASLLEAWRFFTGRRHQVAGRFATQVYAAWLEEAIHIGDVEIPKGAPSFYDMRTAWCRAEWIGAPKGHIDELKETSARRLQYGLFTTTLEKLCAEQGLDWEEVIAQRAREEKFMRVHGIDPDRVGINGSNRTTTPTERELEIQETAAS